MGKRLILHAVLLVAACSPLLLWPYHSGSQHVICGGDSLYLGLVTPGQVLIRRITVDNPSEDKVHFDVEADSGCLKITPRQFVLQVGEATHQWVQWVKVQGDEREGAFAHAAGDIKVRDSRGDQVRTHSVKVTASFLEPIQWDRNGLSQDRIMGDSDPVVISCSRTLTGMAAPVIDATEGWVDRAEVVWNDQINSGEIRVWPKRGLSQGLHDGGVRFQERHPLPPRLCRVTMSTDPSLTSRSRCHRDRSRLEFARAAGVSGIPR